MDTSLQSVFNRLGKSNKLTFTEVLETIVKDAIKVVLHNYAERDIKLCIYKLLKDAADRDGRRKRRRLSSKMDSVKRLPQFETDESN